MSPDNALPAILIWPLINFYRWKSPRAWVGNSNSPTCELIHSRCWRNRLWLVLSPRARQDQVALDTCHQTTGGAVTGHKTSGWWDPVYLEDGAVPSPATPLCPPQSSVSTVRAGTSWGILKYFPNWIGVGRGLKAACASYQDRRLCHLRSTPQPSHGRFLVTFLTTSQGHAAGAAGMDHLKKSWATNRLGRKDPRWCPT